MATVLPMYKIIITHGYLSIFVRIIYHTSILVLLRRIAEARCAVNVPANFLRRPASRALPRERSLARNFSRLTPIPRSETKSRRCAAELTLESVPRARARSLFPRGEQPRRQQTHRRTTRDLLAFRVDLGVGVGRAAGENFGAVPALCRCGF